jgi:methionyl aminopeptidase
VFDNIVSQNAYPTPIGFMHFPKSVCVSVNECIVHGIPSTRPLDPGDKINIDITAYIDGYHGDNNLTVFYGEPEDQIKLKVMEVTQQAVYAAIAICKPGAMVN